MKTISIIIDKDFLKQKHIDYNNEWVCEEQDKQYWVSESTDKFANEEAYFDRATGNFTISIQTEGCFVSIEVSLLTLIDAATKVNLKHSLSQLIEKAKEAKETMEQNI